MARKAFCIILAYYRPLTLSEMNVAVHLDLGTEQHPELESDEDFAISQRNWCGLLVLSVTTRSILFTKRLESFWFRKVSLMQITKPSQ